MKRYLIGILITLLFPLTGRGQESTLIPKLLAQLKLKSKDCKEDFIMEKVLPYDKGKSIVVIPKISVMEEDLFALDSYILLVDNKSGKILNRFWESAETNGRTSDAIRMESISRLMLLHIN